MHTVSSTLHFRHLPCAHTTHNAPRHCHRKTTCYLHLCFHQTNVTLVVPLTSKHPNNTLAQTRPKSQPALFQRKPTSCFHTSLSNPVSLPGAVMICQSIGTPEGPIDTCVHLARLAGLQGGAMWLGKGPPAGWGSWVRRLGPLSLAPSRPGLRDASPGQLQIGQHRAASHSRHAAAWPRRRRSLPASNPAFDHHNTLAHTLHSPQIAASGLTGDTATKHAGSSCWRCWGREERPEGR